MHHIPNLACLLVILFFFGCTQNIPVATSEPSLQEKPGDLPESAENIERSKKIIELRKEFERTYMEGKKLFDEQKYKESIEKFEYVVEMLRWFPTSKGITTEAETYLKQARKKLEHQAIPDQPKR